jgi:hypothetical protein
MNAAELLIELETQGVIVTACDGRLRLDAPKGILTPHVQERVRASKFDIMDALRQPSARRLSAMLSRMDDGDTRQMFRDLFEERAGVFEYECGLSRDEAERLAFEHVRDLIQRE